MNCHQCSTNKQKKCHVSLKYPQNRDKWQEYPLRIALVGMPNVGKSALFNSLTDNYVVVSNYPGTTVEITQGKLQLGSDYFCLIDTPGIYSLVPISEEEKVARNLLLTTSLDLIIHVIDAKNLRHNLSLSLELLEAKLPLILALNMMDEVEDLGLRLNQDLLEKQLGVPVVPIAATEGLGITLLKRRIMLYVTALGLSSSHRDSNYRDRIAII